MSRYTMRNNVHFQTNHLLKVMKFRHIAVVLCVTSLMVSCSSKRDTLSYFQDIQPETFSVTIDNTAIEPTIEPEDELLISVTSILPEMALPYNLPMVNPATATNGFIPVSTPHQASYFVSPQGDITMPVLGKIHVAGMTTDELAQKLTTRIAQDIDDPTVTVALVNFKINVAGEVTLPGQYNVDAKRISILDALSKAGDLTPYGDRSRVMLVREENGKRVAHILDLTSSETLSSPYFFLKQNDYIYVSPNKIRKDNSKYNQNNAYKLSVISTVVSAASVIASLVIALSIK